MTAVSIVADTIADARLVTAAESVVVVTIAAYCLPAVAISIVVVANACLCIAASTVAVVCTNIRNSLSSISSVGTGSVFSTGYVLATVSSGEEEEEADKGAQIPR
jgi:hypothetical protein